MKMIQSLKKLFAPARLQSPDIAQLLVKQLGVRVSRTTVKEAIQNHPDSMTILSVNDCLTGWGVESSVFRVDKQDLKNQPLYFPFVAHFPDNGGHFLLVHKMENDLVYHTGNGERQGQMPLADFLKIWSGVALHATVKAGNGEPNYVAQRTKEILRSLLIPGTALVLISLLTQLFSSASFIAPLLLLSVLKLSGIAISVLLLIQSLNANNPFIKNLCTLGAKSDCNAILKSDAAKVTSWLSWSEVGFFYFTGSFLFLLFSPATLWLPAWLNVLALPYTIYSLSYQYRHKNWCILCCGVQALLILEGITFGIGQAYQIPSEGLNALLATKAILSFLIPVLSWGFLKPFFKQSAQLIPVKNKLKKFKYNEVLFQQALQNQPKYAVSDELMPVMLGNPEAETVITMVSNPFCNPCAQAHQMLDEWLKYRDDIQLKIVFATARDDKRSKIAKHLCALNQQKAALAKEAMNDWYADPVKNYDNWALKYPIAIADDVDSANERQILWCDLAEVTVTPTFFVNGYKLPDPYRLEDLKYLIT